MSKLTIQMNRQVILTNEPNAMKYTPETVKTITDAIRDLKGRVQACKEGGISYETFCQMDARNKSRSFRRR